MKKGFIIFCLLIFGVVFLTQCASEPASPAVSVSSKPIATSNDYAWKFMEIFYRVSANTDTRIIMFTVSENLNGTITDTNITNYTGVYSFLYDYYYFIDPQRYSPGDHIELTFTVTNIEGKSTSVSADLDIIDIIAPSIFVTPSNTSAIPGDSVIFTITGAGPQQLIYLQAIPNHDAAQTETFTFDIDENLGFTRQYTYNIDSLFPDSITQIAINFFLIDSALQADSKYSYIDILAK